MILSNFATLRLKGHSCMDASLQIAEQLHDRDGTWFARKVRMLACHYQIFEQLPIERRGGIRNARTLLKDELVKKRILNYLQSLPTGKVTPKKLQVAVSTEILPDLGSHPKSLLALGPLVAGLSNLVGDTHRSRKAFIWMAMSVLTLLSTTKIISFPPWQSLKSEWHITKVPT